MRLLIFIALLPALGFTACERRPNVPEQVTVVVERYKPLPTWATDPLPVQARAGDAVESYIRSEKALGTVADLANCHRRLLVKLDRGEAVDKRECDR